MTESRSAILNRLKVKTAGVPPSSALIQPAFDKSPDKLVQRIKEKLEAVHASVDIASSARQTGQSIIDFLSSHHCDLEVGVIPEIDTGSLTLEQGIRFYICKDFSRCKTVLTTATCGIAENGTLVLPSSVERPTLANFLPDNCIVILNENDIVPYIEEAFVNVQKSGAGMPRALNLISGPSKTADIEQTLVYGAHGPIQLHVIIRQNIHT